MKKLLSVLLAMAMLLTCVPLGTLSVSAAITGENVRNANVRYNDNSFTEDTGLNADFVFLANNYPEYLSNNAAHIATSNCLDCCNTVIQSYDKNDNRLLAFAESFVNGTEILIKEVGSKLGVAQSTEEEWLQKNATEYLRLVSGCENIIGDEWNNVAKKYKDFKFSIKGIDTMDSVAVASKQSEFIKAVSGRTGCLSEAEAKTLAERLIKKQPNGISKFFSTVDYAVDLADVMLFSCQMLEVETSVLKRLQSQISSDSSLYKGIDLVLDAIEDDPAGWVLEKYLSNQVLDIIQGEILEKVVDWTAEQLVGGDFGIIRKAVKITASLLYNYVYQGAKIDEIYGAIVAYDFYVTVSSPFMQQQTAFLQCKLNNQEVTEQMLLDFIFLYEARRKAMLHYTEACITIDKRGYDSLLERYQEFFADDGALAFDNYIALCMNQLKADIDAGKVTMATIDAGTYFIKNKGTGKYLDVDGAIDARGQNIWVYAFNGHDSEKFEITPSATTKGYKIRPLCSASRVVNASGDTVSSGANVCLWDNVDEYTESQRWNFEAVNGGYVIRNVQVPSCVLTVQSDNNVCVQTYTGADSQIWTLESVGAENYEYAMFPMEHLNITQGVNGSFSHQGTKAIDIAGKDSGIDVAYAPFTGVVKRIYKEYVVWLESSNPVVFADGTIDYMTIMVMHDNDTSDLYVGKTIKQGERFFEEGTAGYATGNHIHLECAKGKFQGNGWYENSQGNWVIYNSINPYDALYLSSETVIKNDYGYNWKYVSSTPSTPITYATIDTGVYALKNKGNQLYMNVAYGLDENAQNIHTYEFGYWNSQLYEITPSTTTAGYMMRPLSSAARVVNVYADNVVSGKNVCIYNNTGDGSQRWNFEKVEDGFVIRNVQNPSCVLAVVGSSDVGVQTYSGADNQIWTLENVVSYDANGGTGAPKLQLKNYNESITLSATKPSKNGYIFKGWATDASATEAQYASGGAYNRNANIKLYAVWECIHTYDNGCDVDCNVCGAVREVADHIYRSEITVEPTCSWAGEILYTCSACWHSYTEEIPVTDEHSQIPLYGYDPTCTEEGRTDGVGCGICGLVLTEQEVISATGHDYEEIVWEYPTCDTVGLMIYDCCYCHDQYSEAIPATGKHTYDSQVTKAATCTTSGVRTYTCKGCDHEYTETIPALGHTGLVVSGYAATCTMTGKTDGEKCSVCGAILKAQEIIPATDHAYDNAFDIACNNCGEIRVVEFPADAPVFVVDSTTARAGEEFTVAIRTQRNSGIVSLKLDVAYDTDVLELVAAEEKDFAGVSFGPETKIPFVVNWVDALRPNNTTDGVVALLTFRVKEGAALGETMITLSYNSDNVFDQNFDSVAFCIENGFVEVVDYVSGDVSGDGTINNRDLALLQQYINGWPVEVVAASCDVDASGTINNRDLALLQQYINGWPVELK